MTTIARFFNLMDAELAKVRLESAGIPVFLADEAAMTSGYGPVTGGVRLQVREEDVERATEMLKGQTGIELPEDFELPEVSLADLEPRRATPILPIAIALGVLAVVMAVLIHQQSEQKRGKSGEMYEEDRNGDGKGDIFWRYENGVLVSGTADDNFDGRIDLWSRYQGGRTISDEQDTDFDGEADSFFSYRNGVVISSTQDRDFNGAPDAFTTYANGIIAQTDYRPNNSPIVTRRLIYERGVLRQELVDDDVDGTFDTKIEYDAFSKPVSTTSLK